jgi:hypothetical protein
MEYVDFELEIGARSGRAYALSVLRSPAGEPRGTFLPLDRRTLEVRLLGLENALLRSGATQRRVAPPDEAPVRALGQELFGALLNGEIRACYQQSQRMTRERGKGLRLKLRIQLPELAALPWEFLYDPGEEEYVCLSRRTPIVRYLETRYPPPPLDLRPPLRILGVVSSPDGLPKLDTPAEQARVEQSLSDLREAGLVDLLWLPGQTWSHLQTALWAGPWHIFHFIGHGGFDAERDEGVLAFANDDGTKRLLTATEFGRLLGDHDPLRLAVLNACEGARGGLRDVFSSTAATLVRRGVPAVVSMQYEISDGAAIQFGTRFYAALAHNLPVDAALAEARIGMSVATSESAEWGTPVLYTNSPDARLFNLSEVRSIVTQGAKGSTRPSTTDQLQQRWEQALAYIQAEQWNQAAQLLTTIVAEQPDYRDAAARLEVVRSHARVDELYAEARALQASGSWQASLDVLQQIRALDPDYRDSDGLTHIAREALSKPEPQVSPDPVVPPATATKASIPERTPVAASALSKVVLFGIWFALALFIEHSSYEEAKMPFQLPSRLDVAVLGYQPSWVWAGGGAVVAVVFMLYLASRSRTSISWSRVLFGAALVGIACVLLEALTGSIKQFIQVEDPKLITTELTLPFALLFVTTVLGDVAIGALTGLLIWAYCKWSRVVLAERPATLSRAAGGGAGSGAAVSWVWAFPQLLPVAGVLALTLGLWGLFHGSGGEPGD